MRLGDRAEEAVADLLEAQGYAVLGRNLRVGRLELDVVAVGGGLVVLVEVRTRAIGGFESALASVSAAKQERLLRAGERLWLERLRFIEEPRVGGMRIDVAAVAFDGGVTRVEHVKGAVLGGPRRSAHHAQAVEMEGDSGASGAPGRSEGGGP